MKIMFKNFVKRSCGLHYIQNYVVREGSQGTNLQSKSIVTSCHAVTETAQIARVVSHFGESGQRTAQSFEPELADEHIILSIFAKRG
jgi:hypothetical protein